jgi:isochorismate hydrolase
MALGLSGVLKRCLRRDAPGRQLVEKVVPDAADYVVLKLKHSAFYATPLETLLSI